MARVQTGLETLLKNPPAWPAGFRLGLLCNTASVDRSFRHARHIVDRLYPGKLTALFSPQHGFYSEKQDNMVESADSVESELGIPVFSLYGKTRQPRRDMFDLIDVLIVDLQDVGTRVYTFIYTLSYCMEAARQLGKKVVVLDRPNPVNGITVEGNCLAEDCVSFVGRYPIPMRHGLTIGELALLFNRHFGIGCELEIVEMKNWRRRMFFHDTGLPWIPPSPNLPTPASAMVYPGQVLWEGTNVSEGRGTTQPFELFGAPFVDPQRVSGTLDRSASTGVFLRPTIFEPTANKWSGQTCRGFQLHVTDPFRFRPYATSLGLIQSVIRHHQGQFEWKPPPYEYEVQKLPIDLIIGDKTVRRRLASLEPLADITASWRQALNDFVKISSEYHLYQ
ncbi:MAG: hypothetical protein AMJ54_11650 [Deltaproteobacteria bacterium SG8_13]|nr:MAG: hypothetical protein AMJ54_11650 [Deltaproteobacteria bacterium SG8_13]